jgi:hypothetical protein
MRAGPIALACAALAALVAWPGAALGQGGALVLVVATPSRQPLAYRIAAELAALDLEALLLTSNAETLDEAELARLAADRHAGAGVALLDTVEVWRMDPAAPRVLGREVVPGAPGPADDGVLAVRVAEFVRASLLEVRPHRHPVEAPAELEVAPPAVDAAGLAPSRPRSVFIGLEAAAAWSPGGLGATWHLALDLAWVPLRWLGVHLLGIGPVAPGELSGPEGRADVWIGLVGGGARLRCLDPTRSVGLDVDVGAAALILGGRGEAAPSYLSRNGTAATAAPYLRLLLSWRPARWLRLRLDAIVGVTLSELKLFFVERAVAAWGRPFVAVGLGVDLAPR